MQIILEIFFHIIGEWFERRKKRQSRPVPKIVGSVPYCPLKR